MDAMSPAFADVSAAPYISLTTFTRDGRPKSTPVWAAPSADDPAAVWIISEASAWKVKRIRNTSRVTIAVCDVRGRVRGEAVEARASLLDPDRNGAVYAQLRKRYGLLGGGFELMSRLRGGMKRNIGIELRAV